MQMTGIIGEDVAEKLQSAVELYDYKPRRTVLRDGGKKWLVSSSMQKAIRRGDVDTALDLVEGLCTFDPNYAWRRLGVVVVEDIGVGNLELCRQYFWASMNRRRMWGNGDATKTLCYLVEQMCRSPKDRNSCEMGTLAEHSVSRNDLRSKLYSVSADSLVRLLARTDDMDEALMSAWLLATGRSRPKVSPSNGKTRLLEAYAKRGCPEQMLETIDWGLKVQWSQMPAFLPLVNDLFLAGDGEFRDDEFWQAPKIGVYPSEGLDRHCGEGKRAIGYWLKMRADLKKRLSELMPHDKVFEVAGTAVFVVEATRCRNRLVYPYWDVIDDEAMRTMTCKGAGCPPEAFDEVTALVKEALPDLHEARVRIMGYAGRW